MGNRNCEADSGKRPPQPLRRQARQGTPANPAVKTFADFRAFSKAGRELAHWHLNYETVACHPGVVVVCGKE